VETNPFAIESGPTTQNIISTPNQFPINSQKNLDPFGSNVLIANVDAPTYWVGFDGNDSFDPFDAMDNDMKKQLRLNPYGGEHEGNVYLQRNKKVQAEFMDKVKQENK